LKIEGTILEEKSSSFTMTWKRRGWFSNRAVIYPMNGDVRMEFQLSCFYLVDKKGRIEEEYTENLNRKKNSFFICVTKRVMPLITLTIFTKRRSGTPYSVHSAVLISMITSRIR
jgi:hypothetical protein